MAIELSAVRGRGASIALIGSLLVLLLAWSQLGPRASLAASSRDEVRILAGAPVSIDPAVEGDSASSAVSAQLFETMTAFDSSLNLQPALAGSWEILDGGRRVLFHLRSGLTFSDGSALTATDVTRSWLRLIDPARPSPLANLMDDVVGAAAFRTGTSSDPSSVGLHADGLDLSVNLVRPAADFPAVVSSPTFGIVPPTVGSDPAALTAGRFVGSGAYVLTAQTAAELTLTGNPHYWAGRPAIGTVHLVSDIAGQSPVAAFEAGNLDYSPVGGFDASWIRYDATLGPQLRSVPTLSVEYLGFDTRRPPFDDVRVRQAFGAAVDWRRIVALGGNGTDVAATSLVPPGIEGRSSADFVPALDPARGRALLADAGYPGGRGFPSISFVTDGSPYAAAIRADLARVLGVSIGEETMASDVFFARLASDPPALWSLSWIADYPGQNDFLGLLLRTGSTNNYGRWSSAAFDAAIAAAGAAPDAAGSNAAFARAQAVVESDVPVVPLAYGTEWALARTGLLGAGGNGLGILRTGGLAWSGQ